MYLTAQRVRSRQSGQEGVNAFFHSHGTHTWHEEPPPELLPEQEPGELVHEHIEVPPPGNAVRSYLDIIAPDEITTPQIVEKARRLLDGAEARALPWNVAFGNCLFRFGLEQALLPRWNEELGALLRAALQVRRGL